MKILVNDQWFTVDYAADLDDGLLGERISKVERENEFDVEFIHTDHLYAYLELIEKNPDEMSAICSYVSNVQPSDRTEDFINQFHEAYQGDFADEATFAEEKSADLYGEHLKQMPPEIASAINWKKVWDSTLRFSYWYHGTHYFLEI